MELNICPRHSRLSFVPVANAGGLATTIAGNKTNQSEIIDFSPGSAPAAQGQVSAGRISGSNTEAILSKEPTSQCKISSASDAPSNNDDTSLRRITLFAIKRIQKSGKSVQNLRRHSAAPQIDFTPEADFAVNKKPYPHEKTYFEEKPFEGKAVYRSHANVEVLPNGKRVETFDNGSIVNKDALGRVVEIFSRFGESLFIEYDSSGSLSSFTRVDPRGAIHSTGKKDRHGITVRDAAGRVKAAGQYMTVDPCGRFFLHTNNDQYFCLDLVSGFHCERRRVVNAKGKINFVTAAFTHDGFRMATVYARHLNEMPRRQMTYRFYGRDGSVVDFRCEDEFKDLNPARSMPPGSFPVHASWRRSRQAQTAWESVKEYLSLVEVQAQGAFKAPLQKAHSRL